MSIRTASHGPASPTQGIPVVTPTVWIPRIPQQRPSRGDWPDLRSGRPSRPSRLIRHRGPRRRIHGLLDTRVLAVAAAGYVIADGVYGGPLSFVAGWVGIAFFGGLLALASLAEALLSLLG